jgi:hypothetical protein
MGKFLVNTITTLVIVLVLGWIRQDLAFKILLFGIGWIIIYTLVTGIKGYASASNDEKDNGRSELQGYENNLPVIEHNPARKVPGQQLFFKTLCLLGIVVIICVVFGSKIWW